MENGSLRVCLVHTMGVLVANFSLPSEYGWYGYGGVIMQWHPTLKIAFGYAQTNVRWYDRLYKIGGKLQKSVLDCHIARPLSTTGP